MPPRTLTSESVTEGHPDKVADYIADRVLDAHLRGDPHARVAVEVLCKGKTVILAGEVTSIATVDLEGVARKSIADIGYGEVGEGVDSDSGRSDGSGHGFDSGCVEVITRFTAQAPEIGRAVGRGCRGLGAGDQGVMYGYATDETPELMPLPILLAHRLAAGLAEDRLSGSAPWLRPDGKTQVWVRYADDRPIELERVLISAQHDRSACGEEIAEYVKSNLAPRCLASWFGAHIEWLVNPAGSFIQGGPCADCGLTGRKIIADTYGGLARHGGGAFSGKDPTKVDRSAAYFCRYAARRIVQEGLARRAEVGVSYAIGSSRPAHIDVATFGTGSEAEARRFLEQFDFSPAAIIERLGLRSVIYAATTNYGHFGRPGFPWER